MSSILRCEKCKSTGTFFATAREIHTWLVDKYGDFEEDIECYDATTDNTDYRCSRPDCDGFGEWEDEN